MSTTGRTARSTALDYDTGKGVNDALSDAEATEYLRLRPGSLARMRLERRGPAWSYIGKRVIYLRSDVLAFLAANRVEPTGTA
jgi:hypothetical protein